MIPIWALLLCVLVALVVGWAVGNLHAARDYRTYIEDNDLELKRRVPRDRLNSADEEDYDPEWDEFDVGLTEEDGR